MLIERTMTIPVTELCEKLDVSQKTILNDVQALNVMLSGTALIEKEGRNLSLYLFDIPRFVAVRDQILRPEQDFLNPDVRLFYIADVLMSTNTPVLIDDLAAEMDVSRSTLTGDLKRLRGLLAAYDIAIVGRPNTGLFTEGEEIAIRRFLTGPAYAFLYSAHMLSPAVLKPVRAVMEAHEIELGTQDTLLAYLNVALDRAAAGHALRLEDPVYEELRGSGFYQLADEILTAAETPSGVRLNDAERLYLTIPLSGMRTPVNYRAVEDYVEIGAPVLELVEAIIGRIQKETDLVFQFSDVFDEFIYHLTFMRNRLIYNIHLENPVKDEMKKKFPFAWSVAGIAAAVIEEKLGTPVSADERAFLSSYFEIFIKEQESRTRRPFNVLVLTSGGSASRRLIARQLEKMLDPDAEIEFASRPDQAVRGVHDYALVITTVPTQLPEDVTAIRLNEVFDETMLREQIEKIRYLKNVNIPMKNASSSVLLSLLSEEHFFVFENESYEAVLRKMCGCLEEKGLVDCSFLERLFEREREATMRFSQSVSFPHTFSENGTHAHIVLGVTRNGLEEPGFEDLRLIFLAALPRQAEDDLTLVRLYEEILKISEDAQAVADISSMQSYEELLHYFIVRHPIFTPQRH